MALPCDASQAPSYAGIMGVISHGCDKTWKRRALFTIKIACILIKLLKISKATITHSTKRTCTKNDPTNANINTNSPKNDEPPYFQLPPYKNNMTLSFEVSVAVFDTNTFR